MNICGTIYEYDPSHHHHHHIIIIIIISCGFLSAQAV